MIFEELKTARCEGKILAHSQRLSDGKIAKGTRLSAHHVERLIASGIRRLLVFTLAEDDVAEDLAAQALAQHLLSDDLVAGTPARGRVNLYAAVDGLWTVNRQQLNSLNAIDEAITVATKPDGATVAAGDMLATIKIIPFAVAAAQLERVRLRAQRGLFRLDAFRSRSVLLVQTTNELTPDKMLAKTDRVLRDRCVRYGISADAVTSVSCPHDRDSLARLLTNQPQAELTVIVGATAITDRADVIPAALSQAGGTVLHLGLPVDPGNLLMLGRLHGLPVIGAPGCARAPAENGLDLVLARLLSDQPMDSQTLTEMGAGGLLKEDSDARLIPREPLSGNPPPSARSKRFAVLLLAGGFGRRMGATDKLSLVVAEGLSMLDATARQLENAGIAWHQQVLVQRSGGPTRARNGWQSATVSQDREAAVMSDSLGQGIAALAPEIDAVVIALGDMPKVRPETVERLCEAFDPSGGTWAVRPKFNGKLGNPVLVGKRFFERLQQLTGDRGARALLDSQSHLVRDIEVDDPVS